MLTFNATVCPSVAEADLSYVLLDGSTMRATLLSFLEKKENAELDKFIPFVNGSLILSTDVSAPLDVAIYTSFAMFSNYVKSDGFYCMVGECKSKVLSLFGDINHISKAIKSLLAIDSNICKIDDLDSSYLSVDTVFFNTNLFNSKCYVVVYDRP